MKNTKKYFLEVYLSQMIVLWNINNNSSQYTVSLLMNEWILYNYFTCILKFVLDCVLHFYDAMLLNI